jgi:dnd system-associated protein 4
MMRKQSLFSRERLVYWSDEFVDVVNLLTGKDAQGNTTHAPLCPLNADAIVLAAAVGMKHKRKRQLGSGGRKEISTATFASRGLEQYLFLIGLLGGLLSNVDILRPENEEELIKEFEQYATGGLEYLRSDFSHFPTQSVDMVVARLFLSASPASESGAIPNIF